MTKLLLGLSICLAALGVIAPSHAAEDPAVHTFGDKDKACREWSDGCTTCLRPAPDAAPSCSTPGIACLPHETHCVDVPVPTPAKPK